jgi:cell division protein ZapA
MCRIRDAGKVKARDRIAVLAALNLAFDVADKAPAIQATSLVHANGNGGSDAHDPRLANLQQRLDRALGDDGRLI